MNVGNEGGGASEDLEAVDLGVPLHISEASYRAGGGCPEGGPYPVYKGNVGAYLGVAVIEIHRFMGAKA